MLSLKDINKASDTAWAEMKKLCEQAQRANVLAGDLSKTRDELRCAQKTNAELRHAHLTLEEELMTGSLEVIEKRERAEQEATHYRVLQAIQQRREVDLDAEEAARARKWRRSHALACRALWQRDNAIAREEKTTQLYEKVKAERDAAVADLRGVHSYPTVYMKTTLEACVLRNAALDTRNRDLAEKLHEACVRAATAERELAELRASLASERARAAGAGAAGAGADAAAATGGAAAGAKRARYGSLDEDWLIAMVDANEAATV
jgi:hypothetical protein